MGGHAVLVRDSKNLRPLKGSDRWRRGVRLLSFVICASCAFICHSWAIHFFMIHTGIRRIDPESIRLRHWYFWPGCLTAVSFAVTFSVSAGACLWSVVFFRSIQNEADSTSKGFVSAVLLDLRRILVGFFKPRQRTSDDTSDRSHRGSRFCPSPALILLIVLLMMSWIYAAFMMPDPLRDPLRWRWDEFRFVLLLLAIPVVTICWMFGFLIGGVIRGLQALRSGAFVTRRSAIIALLGFSVFALYRSMASQTSSIAAIAEDMRPYIGVLGVDWDLPGSLLGADGSPGLSRQPSAGQRKLGRRHLSTSSLHELLEWV